MSVGRERAPVAGKRVIAVASAKRPVRRKVIVRFRKLPVTAAVGQKVGTKTIRRSTRKLTIALPKRKRRSSTGECRLGVGPAPTPTLVSQ